ncbi:interleukin-1 receptor accessory protein-like isoform X2 [Betta splendens]|uniref:Interleukin-1 receptor accessory protein-like isoform X2 n=1 Tax=Betta splendens TaxID=158456 RepID=A0A6P7PL02_BETSP|nr:interleukin-1 receptor accessory protein-like isoform X2 [Betta splendens]
MPNPSCDITMRLSSAVKGSHGGSPEIIGPRHVHMHACLGKPLILHCDAVTNSEDGVTLIYWLVNNEFPENVPYNDTLVEPEETTLENGAILQRTLLLKNVTSEDLKSSYTCVVTNAFGMARKHMKLSEARNLKNPDCKSRKRKRRL